jgi:alpha-galactosidase
MNRYFTNPGGEGNTASEQKKIWVKYVRNLYEILDRLRKEFPYLIIENCASGGARSDLAMSRFCGRINRSDNQDTLDILRLHEGFTWLHQSKLAGGACHISDAYAKMVNRREVPLQYQAFVGMLGSLAISKNLLECSDEMLSQLGEYVDLYKRLRHVTHLGQLYRLASHHKYPYAVFEYVSDDKKEAVVFIFGHSVQFAYKVPAIRLQGLDEDSIYDIEIFGNKPQTTGYTASIQEYQPISGAGLTEIGVRVELLGDFDARILYLKASDKNRKTQK